MKFDIDWLALELAKNGRLKSTETQNFKGRVIEKKVPSNASMTLAEGEFNRYYIRAVCLYALRNKIKNVIVYRAKMSDNPGPNSEAKIGKTIDSNILLNDLRKNIGVDSALSVPTGVNSGLSVRLP
ncbi:MAG: hypothetical protein LBG48_03910 [Rickettsiales bacterium]|nr:hypothetical protein [Rickettsiales bacterium]